MTPVLMAAALCVGVLIGLRVNARRLAATREQLRVLTDRHDAWNLSAKRTDLDEVGPVTGDHRPVELYDQDALAELREQSGPDELSRSINERWDAAVARLDCPEAGGCRRPDQCTNGCHWLRLRDLNRGVASPVDDDPADTLPHITLRLD